MLSRNWKSNLISRPTTVSVAKQSLSRQLRIDTLEDRSIPAGFRFATESWQPVSGNTIKFNLQQSWNGADFNNPAVGQTRLIQSNEENLKWHFGDGASSDIILTVTEVNSAGNWFVGSATIQHTYSSPGTYTAFMEGEERLSNLQLGNNDRPFRSETTVNVGGGNSSPVSSLPSTIQIPLGLSTTFQFPASDPNGDPITYRLATSAESSLIAQPSGLTLTPSGQLTWLSNVTGLYAAQVMIEDQHGSVNSKIPVDFTIAVSPNSNTAPAVSAPTSQSGIAGATQSFTLGTFSHPNAGTYAVDVDWGDATGHTTFSVSTTSANNSSLGARPHNYATPGLRTVTVKVTNSGGETGTASFVANVAPASAALSVVNVPSTAVTTTTYAASVRLARTSSPTGPLAGQMVTMTLWDPNGNVVGSLHATTSSTGVASFSPFVIPHSMVGASRVIFSGPATAATSAPPDLQVPLTVNAIGVTVLSVPKILTFADTPTAVTATATDANGMPLANLPITFIFPVNRGIENQSATTNAFGQATVIVRTPTAVYDAYTVSYAGIAGVRLPASAINSFVALPVETTLDPLTINSIDVVGNTLTVSTRLSRTDPPAGPLNGKQISFTLSDDNPNTTDEIQSISTASDGRAEVTFTLVTRGMYSITASFDGEDAYWSSVRQSSVAVYQKTLLVMNASHGLATDPTSVSAALYALPGNVPIVGHSVSFDFGGEVASGSALTNENGIATVIRAFPEAGFFTAKASFENLSDYFVDGNANQLPTTATAEVSVSRISTFVELVRPVATAFAGDTLTFTAKLSRITEPASPFVNQTVKFILALPDGRTISRTGITTGQTALASVQFDALPIAGNYTIRATVGDDVLDPASSETSTIVVASNVVISAEPLPYLAYFVDSPMPTLRATFSTAVSGALLGNLGPITITDRNGGFSYGPISTDANGRISVPLNSLLPGRSYALEVRFEGSGYLAASSIEFPEFDVLLPTQLTIAPVTAFAGLATALSAIWSGIPASGFGPRSGHAVTFDFAGVLPSVTVDTDENGLAKIDVMFPNVGEFPISATYIPMAGFTNRDHSYPAADEIEIVTVSVTSSESTTITVGSTPFVYDGSEHAGGSGIVTGSTLR